MMLSTSAVVRNLVKLALVVLIITTAVSLVIQSAFHLTKPAARLAPAPGDVAAENPPPAPAQESESWPGFSPHA